VYKDLASIQARIKKGAAADDAAVQGYLDLVDRGVASATQLNDFAILLSRRGYYPAAAQYQRAATKLEPGNATLWVNLGTLQRAAGSNSAAGTAYKHALDLDPNNAYAHYHLGTVLESQGSYDDAIEQYRIAVTLDPRLADPKYNPQVVNNDRMLVVNLMNYAGKGGAMGLPLLPTTPAPQEKPPVAPASPPAATPAPAPAPAAAPAATPASTTPTTPATSAAPAAQKPPAQRRRAAEQAQEKKP
jgi:tetratricopeptide (TPR) repeat protein